ncbi:MAG TPA: ABC transporter permease subunit [Acidimicrobiales bacterium]|nr:ABC transporter permease subunit [Acidimicrobiales bacterium]
MAGWWRRGSFVAVVAFPFAFLAAFVVYPLWQEVWGSFASWYQLKPQGFAGTHNYAVLFDDILVPVSSLHTAFYLLLTVPIEVFGGLVAAWLTLRARRLQGLLAVVFLVPLVVPWTVAGELFYGLFNLHGVVDQLSQDVFGSGAHFEWFFHPRLAFGVIVLLGVWKGAPWCYLLLLGALSGCPDDVFEAARIDGARGTAFWWRVVIPAVRPMFVLVIVLRLIAEAQTYDSVAMLTNGGPGFPGATELVGFYANIVAFSYQNFGEASALGTLVGAVLVGIAAGGWALTRRRNWWRRRYLAVPWHHRAFARLSGGSAAWREARHRARAPKPGALGRRGWLVRALSSSPARWATLAVMAVAVLVPFAGEEPSWLGRYEFAGTFWPAIKTGLWNTLILSGATLLGTFALAVPAAYLLAFKRFRLRPAMFGFILFTLAIPGIIFIYPQFEEIVWMGLVNTRTGIACLYIATNLPLAVFFLRPAFAGVPTPLLEAMRVDGASSLGILRRLVLRYSASTMIALGVLIVVWVWGEEPIALAVLSPTNQSAFTLPLLLAQGQLGNPNAVYLLSIAFPLVLFLATQRFFRRGLVSATLL